MRLVKVFVAALVALLISSMGLAAPAWAMAGTAGGANVDQCAPPGVESASALPTNLAKAATGPGADKYTTATVEPLTAVNVNALGLGAPGTLTVGTLSDAPPSICINSAGQFTGFDNELLRAIADRLGLKINFVGTEFSGLLAQVASRRFDVGSSSITTTDARRRTVGFTNGYDFGYFSLVVPSGSPITGFDKLAAASASASCRAPCRRRTSIDTLHLEPVKFPDYNTVYASLKTRQIDAWVAPSSRHGHGAAGRPGADHRKHLQLGQFRGVGGRQGEPATHRRVELRAGRDHRRRHLGAAVHRLGAARVAARMEARVEGGAACRSCPTSRRSRPSHQQPAPCGRAEVDAVAARDSFLDWDLYQQAIPDLFKTGLPNTLILTVSASVIGLVLGMALAVAGISRQRWLRWPARVYTDIFRGLPEVVIILLIGLGVGPVVGGLTGNNPYPLGIAALGADGGGLRRRDLPVRDPERGARAAGGVTRAWASATRRRCGWWWCRRACAGCCPR